MIARIILLLMCFVAVCPAQAKENITAESARPPAELRLCGESVPLSQSDVRERFEKEMLLALGDKPQVILWLKRTTRYLPFIAQELHKAGMPDDLKYLAIVESALRPYADSSRGAVGFWQLMPETARRYGLNVNAYVDQRRDLAASTRAALLYLKDLQAQFSSWTLALAAYNMGEQGLDAEMLAQGPDNFYQLYLPLETQQFIFRILAVKRIVSDPSVYGFNLSSIDFYKPLDFETVMLDCFEETPIRLVAQAANTYFKMIKELNPHLLGHYLQAGRQELNLPPGSADGFADRLQKLMTDYNAAAQQRIYIVQGGDSLYSIAQKFDVPLAVLIIWNRIDLNKTLHPGDRLVIFPRPNAKAEP